MAKFEIGLVSSLAVTPVPGRMEALQQGDFYTLYITNKDGVRKAPAVLAHTHTFSSLTDKPTTLAGYGITDAASAVHTHSQGDIVNLTTDLANRVLKAGDSMSGNLTFSNDNRGVFFYGGGAVYKRSGGGPVLRRSSGDPEWQIESNDGSSRWDIWHAGNLNMAGYVSTGRRVDTSGSLQGGGDLSGNRTLSLVGDSGTPGNSKYYGTNGSGSKGFWDLPSGGGITGSGISGRIAKWSSGSSINSSNIYEESDGRIGIGSANPSYEILYVFGHIGVTNNVNMNTSRSQFLKSNKGMFGSMDDSNHSSAALQVNSTSQGLLPPRMTTSEWNGISSKATGLQSYLTDADGIVWRSGSGRTCILRWNEGTSKYQVWVEPSLTFVNIH